MLIGTYTQQPADRLDYDIPCTLASGDSIASVAAVVTPSPGLTVTAVNDSPNVKLWVESGTLGTYKVDVTITTGLGRVKQVEVRFRIKEY